MPKIEINEHTNDQFLKTKIGQSKSLTQICNEFIEKLVNDEVVFLEMKNLSQYKHCASSMQSSVSFIVNSLLSRIDPEPETEPEKIKMKVSSIKEIVRIKKNNRVVNWE